jgi:hypothetical protein
MMKQVLELLFFPEEDRTRAGGGQGLPTQQGGVAQTLAAPTYCVTTLVAS